MALSGRSMAEHIKLDQALNRLETALRHIEAALGRAQEDRLRAQARQSEVDALQHDRSQLARELDLARAKASQLIDTNQQAVVKIDAAMSRIRAVLDANSGG